MSLKLKKKLKKSFSEQKEFKQLEKEIEKLENRKKEINSEFENENISGDEIQILSKELGEVNNTIDKKEERWMELSMKLEE